MELCEYSKEEIDSTVNNSYSSMVIKPENAPILVLDDIVNQMQDELYIKMIIRKLLDNCNIEELNTISELNNKEKNKVIKVIKNYVKDNEKEIKKQKQSLDDLKKLNDWQNCGGLPIFFNEKLDDYDSYGKKNDKYIIINDLLKIYDII